jgi:hypothetical protein
MYLPHRGYLHLINARKQALAESLKHSKAFLVSLLSYVYTFTNRSGQGSKTSRGAAEIRWARQSLSEQPAILFRDERCFAFGLQSNKGPELLIVGLPGSSLSVNGDNCVVMRPTTALAEEVRKIIIDR